MSSILLPKNVRDHLKAKRRAFLWTGEEKCHGSSCLVAWEDICKSKEQGGLGVRNLEDMNHCLLLKFVHKLHDDSSAPWKQWFMSRSGSGLGADHDSYIGKLIGHELQRYRDLSTVRIGNGAQTSFWQDRWLLGCPLREAFPVLTLSPRTSLSEKCLALISVFTCGLGSPTLQILSCGFSNTASCMLPWMNARMSTSWTPHPCSV